MSPTLYTPLSPVVEDIFAFASAVELTIPELEKYSSYVAWVDVSKLTEVV